MSTLNINGFNMFYQESGQGEALFLVPGFSSNHRMWDNIVPMLNDKYRVIQLDNRGAGFSDVPEAGFTIETMADDIVALAKHLNIERAYFIGNSMGGAIVQTLAVKYPALTKAIVLSSTFCKTDFRFDLFLEINYKIQESQILSSFDASKFKLVWPFGETFVKNNLTTLLELAAEDLPFSLAGYKLQLAALKQFDSFTWVNQISAPTLMLAGEDDLIITPRLTQILAKQLPQAKLHMFKEVGHVASIEVPDLFVNWVQHFLAASHQP